MPTTDYARTNAGSTQTCELAAFIRNCENNVPFLEATKKHLEYAFQPIVQVRDGRTFGVEALLRGFDTLGFENPIALLNFAHERGCLVALECCLREKAITTFAALDRDPGTRLFVNVDGRVLDHDGFLIAETLELAARMELEPQLICLELSESSEMASIERIEDYRNLTREAGFRFAIDDFGRGYSQLKVLYDFEPDVLKIDRYFIKGIEHDARKHLFVSTLVDLAHVLGMYVVAEGIETREELEACRLIGCDLVQGYLISRPQTRLSQITGHYPAIVRKAHERTAVTIRENVDTHALIEAYQPIPIDAPIDEVLTTFRQNMRQRIVPIVNSVDEPLGIVFEDDLRVYLYNQFGHMLLRNKGIENSIPRFLQRCPIIDINAPLMKLIQSNAGNIGEGIIVTENGRYAGFITTKTLLSITNDARLQEAEDKNPLSKLPGNPLIEAHVRDVAVDSHYDRYFCYVDFDNFKPFNDLYGFRQGDRAIRLFSDLLRRRFRHGDSFIGHVGGDDFFVGFSARSAEDVVSIMQQLRAEFSESAESLYRVEHRMQGFVEAKDRLGRQQQYPMLTCSIGIVQLEQGYACQSIDALSEVISEVKKQAKIQPDGIRIISYSDADTAKQADTMPKSAAG